jgi:hypothetical protein
MPATLSRSLLLSFALALAGPALAQTSDKDPQATPKATGKSSASKPSAAPKRLDFVPSTSVKPATTRQTTPTAPTPAQPPGKMDWHGCEGDSADA